MQANTIDDVLLLLDKIIEDRKVKNSPAGYFPALYRKVTQSVKDGIANGEFEDGQRMERLDVIFANRYLSAYDSFYKNEELTESWKVAFDKSEDFWPIVLQHLLWGINAHINLDLGIAAVETVIEEQEPLANLKHDFDKINELLAKLVDEVQEELSEIWPTLQRILKFTKKVDNFLIDFSMEEARDGAWKFANELYATSDVERQQMINQRDKNVAEIGKKYIYPSGLISHIIFKIIRLGERGTVRKRIAVLED